MSRPSELGAMPEVFVSHRGIAAQVSRAVGDGRLRKIGSRLYTRNLDDAPEDLVRCHLWPIVAGFFPQALIADRTALENVPAADGSVCLVTERGRDIRLPGITLRPRRGVGPLPTDTPFLAGLFLSSRARAFIENMRPSRSRSGLVRRTLHRVEIEERLDALIRSSGEDGANRLRDEARAAASALGLTEESRQFDGIVGALLRTRDAGLRAGPAVARSRGIPYDPERLALFASLASALRDHPPLARFAPRRSAEARATLAFYEAYFSNFIEGTEFEVAEAAGIIFGGVLPRERPQDAHDILGTWRIVSDETEMRRTPTTETALENLMRHRHASILESRPEVRPGAFKLRENRAGQTVFVAPELVRGTLAQGFDLYRSLETPFQRAVFLMFLIAEVHPFTDGNGRMARVMMNAELVASGEERIVVPTVYRANYLAALKALSQSGRSEPLIRVLDYAQRWTAAVSWSSVRETERELADLNAFDDPLVAEEEGRRLRMPGGGIR